MAELTGAQRGTGAKVKAEVGNGIVTFRGAIKADVPFSEITTEVRGSLLCLTFRGQTVDLAAGAKASAIAAKMRKG